MQLGLGREGKERGGKGKGREEGDLETKRVVVVMQ